MRRKAGHLNVSSNYWIRAQQLNTSLSANQWRVGKRPLSQLAESVFTIIPVYLHIMTPCITRNKKRHEIEHKKTTKQNTKRPKVKRPKGRARSFAVPQCACVRARTCVCFSVWVCRWMCLSVGVPVWVKAWWDTFQNVTVARLLFMPQMHC